MLKKTFIAVAFASVLSAVASLIIRRVTAS